MPTTYEIAQQLVALCNAGKHVDAVDALYGDDVISIEAVPVPGLPRELKGKPAVRGKNQWYFEHHTVHRAEAKGPWPMDDQFIVHFLWEVTPDTGPNTGKRLHLEEAALFTVADGKIVKEQFFYARS